MAVKPTETRKWVIYKITNPNGRVYIGKSSNYTQRLRQYKCIQLKKQNLITRSLIKYGIDSHAFEVIDSFVNTGEYSEDKEMFWIRTYMSNYCKYPGVKGMNMTDGGEGATGVIRSQESRDKARDRKLGVPNSEHQKLVASKTQRGNTWANGITMSIEERESRRGKTTGRKDSEEVRLKKTESNILLRGKCITVYDSILNQSMEFKTQKQAANFIGMSRDTLSSILNNKVITQPVLKNRRFTFKLN